MSKAFDDPAWLHEIQQGMAAWRQGDVVRPGTSYYVADPANPGTELSARAQGDAPRSVSETAPGLVVITQTCDLVSKDPGEAPYMSLAVLTELDEQLAEEARAGDRVRYVPVPRIGSAWFADLDRVVTIEKAALFNVERTPGVDPGDEEREFALAVGRKFSRPAFPDDVHRTMQGIAGRFKKRHDKDASPEAPLMQKVLQIRAKAAPGWDADEIDLHLHFLVGVGDLPPTGDAPAEPDAETRAWFDAKTRGPADIAERIQTTTAPDDVTWLWARLGDAWAKQCKPVGSIQTVTAEVVCADEMRVSALWDTERLDLDYLSGADAVSG